MAEPRFLLHIGANKTGTSSIQRMLVQNRDRLNAAGWDYPDFNLLHMAHHPLAYSIAGHPTRGLSGDWQSAFADLTRSTDRRYIFSSELFFRTVSPAETARFFPPDQTRVVLYLREHLAYMTSWYAQAVQERNLIAGFEDYVRVFSQPFIRFLRDWESVYGADRIVVRNFSREHLVGRDSRLDFLAQIDGLDAATIAIPGEESNLSISGNLLFFKRLLNNYMTFEESTAWPIPDEFGAFAAVHPTFNGRFQLSQAEVTAVREIFRADVNALAARGIDLGPMPETVTGHPCPGLNTLREDMRLIKQIATNTNKHFLSYADRWQDWHAL